MTNNHQAPLDKLDEGKEPARLAKCGHVAYRNHSNLCIHEGCPHAAYVTLNGPDPPLSQPAEVEGAGRDAPKDLPDAPGHWTRSTGQFSIVVNACPYLKDGLYFVGWMAGTDISMRGVDYLPRGGWSRAVPASSNAELSALQAKVEELTVERDAALNRAKSMYAEYISALESTQIPPPTQEEIANYCCGNCGSRGIKLWRPVHGTDLKCAKCIAPDVEVNADGKSQSDVGNFLTDNLGDWLPAVPSGDTFWGYTSVPIQGVTWWKLLPTYPTTANQQVAQLRAENEQLTRRDRDSEDQLVRIANHIGKDAAQAPAEDRTIAGATIAALTTATREADELRRDLEDLKERLSYLCSAIESSKHHDGASRVAMASIASVARHIRVTHGIALQEPPRSTT